MSGVGDETLVATGRASPAVSEFSIALAVSLVTFAGVGLVLINAPGDARSIPLPMFVFGAAAMFGFGLAEIARARDPHFARGLIAAGLFWSLSALTASQSPLAYSVGHVNQWVADVAVAYLLLSYPSGRLRSAMQRRVFGGAALLVGLLFVPSVLLGPFPHPSPWATCISSCPTNVFALRTSTPAFVTHVLLPLREALAVGLFATIAVTVISRARSARPLLGQFYVPLAVMAILQMVLFSVYFPLRTADPSSGPLSVVSWIFVLSLPAVALVCGAGQVHRRFQTATALELMARSLGEGASTVGVRLALAEALHDPTLQILHSFPGAFHAWVDESGSPVLPENAEPGERVTHVSSGRWRIAIVHDASLADSRELVQSTGSYALATLEMSQLTDELRESLRNLEEARASRLTAEQDTRQKIERDLHDGAQQRLVALRLKLGLAASALADRDPEGAELLHTLESDVDTAIDEVRSLARGIYPPLLARTGLRGALRSASRGAGLPVIVRAEGLDRYTTEIETTVYFACSEALQNAVKHAQTASGVMISVWQDDELRFEVRDDGAGFDPPTTPQGAGLSNLSDRLRAVGGTITVQSAPGQGTVLAGTIPLALGATIPHA